MELLFLGSGAGELWPSLFCPCESCREAVRSRSPHRGVGSSLLVNGTFLFDLPPNIAMSTLNLGISLADVSHLFVTHSHQDHFDPCVLAAHGRNASRPLQLYCNQRVTDLLPVYQQFNRFFNPDSLGLQIQTLTPGAIVHSPEAGLTLTALAANHDRTNGEEPLIYILEVDSKRLLYACDTGWIPEDSWAAIEQHDYDAVILDCTFHLHRECRDGHLGLAAFLEQKERFAMGGLLRPSAHFIAQHIFRGHGKEHTTAERIAASLSEHNVIVARDGMKVEL